MKTLYMIEHWYDVDGGFGDAVLQTEVVAVTDDKAKAYEYVDKYNNPQAYDKPYATLYCHELRVREIKIEELDLDKDPFADDDRFSAQMEWYKDMQLDDEEDEDNE